MTPVNKNISIYAIHDPTDWSIRYVGISVQPRVRLLQHGAKHAAKSRAGKFIAELRLSGLTPGMSILQNGTQDQGELLELSWIAYLRESGADLSNKSAGGNGPPIGGAHAGMRHSPEALLKIRAAHLGRRHAPEVCTRMSATRKARPELYAAMLKATPSQKGVKRTPEQCATNSRAQKGLKKKPWTAERKAAASELRRGKAFSTEHRAALSAARKGVKLSPEHRAHIGAGGRVAWQNRRRKART